MQENYAPGMAPSFAQVARRRKKPWKGEEEVCQLLSHSLYLSSLSSQID